MPPKKANPKKRAADDSPASSNKKQKAGSSKKAAAPAAAASSSSKKGKAAATASSSKAKATPAAKGKASSSKKKADTGAKPAKPAYTISTAMQIYYAQEAAKKAMAAKTAQSPALIPSKNGFTLKSPQLMKIFSFCELKQLGAASQVSKMFLQAACDTPSIGWHLYVLWAEKIPAFLKSPLRHHVTLWHAPQFGAQDASEIQYGSLDHLKLLRVTIDPSSLADPQAPLPVLPPNLTDLELDLSVKRDSEQSKVSLEYYWAQVKQFLQLLVTALPKLQSFKLTLSPNTLDVTKPLLDWRNETKPTETQLVPVDLFTPLHAWKDNLKTMELQCWATFLPSASRLALAATLPNLTNLKMALDLEDLKALSKMPCAKTIQNLNQAEDLNAEVVALYPSFPSLTTLESYKIETSDVSFLRHLKNMTSLNLTWHGRAEVTPEHLVDSIKHCTKMKKLSLHHPTIDSHHLAQLLPNYPELEQLEFHCCFALKSLKFLTQVPHLAKTVNKFAISFGGQFPIAEFESLKKLRAVRDLDLTKAFNMSPERVNTLTPFMPQFDRDAWPNLVKFKYEAATGGKPA